ncbi:MAG TPA: hypothetical protein VF276_15790 [Chloroflexia bacterium]
MQTLLPPIREPPVAPLDDGPDPEEPRPAPFAFLDPAPVTGGRLWGVIVISALFTGVLIALESGTSPWIVSLGRAIIWLALTALAVLGMTIWESEDRVPVKVAIGGFMLLMWFGL